jgi:hypothetical protein
MLVEIAKKILEGEAVEKQALADPVRSSGATQPPRAAINTRAIVR